MSYSIGFPDIFNESKVNLYEGTEAVKSDLYLLLGSEKGQLIGDPAFGTKLKPILWDQAHRNIAEELVKDEIFQSIYSYMPQVDFSRNNIEVSIQDNYMNVSIHVAHDKDVIQDLFSIKLLKEDEIEEDF